MPDTRVFLDPKQPLLPQVARYLVDRYRDGNEVHCDRALVVVPGTRAGRNLLDLILDQTASRQLAYWPPTITSFGALPEHLYVPRRALASPTTQQLAWCRALRTADSATLSYIIPPPGDGVRAPLGDDWTEERSLHLGELFYSYYRHLAADGYSFADVAQIVAQDEAMTDGERWQAMGVIQEGYLRLLDHLELWDMQTARLVAVRHQECHTERDVILVGTVDLPRTVRSMLDQVRNCVTPLVYAATSWADSFDEYGTLIPEAWQTSSIPIAETRIHVVEGPTEQANQVCHILSTYEGRFRADQIVIGVPDDRLLSYVQRALDEFSVRSRWGPGESVRQSGPWRMLAAIGDLLREPSTAAWGTLLRHPDLYDHFAKAGVTSGLLPEFDDYCQSFVPSTLDGDWAGSSPPEQVVTAYNLVQHWIAPLQGPHQSLREWCGGLSELLLILYGNREYDLQRNDERATWDACQVLHETIAELHQLPVELDHEMSSIDAIQWVLKNSASGMLGSLPDPNAIELLGWLDLLHDDAVAMVVTTFNEGYVPTSVRTDPFLPNALRTRLGLDDNARRFARDAYTLQMLIGSRQEFDLVVARRAPDDEPLLPSRLLFATNDMQLPYRAMRLLSEGDASSIILDRTANGPWPTETEFRIPRPVRQENAITQLSATGVRQYLECPYRFYLSHVLRLRSATDVAYEIDASRFGILLHQVMDSFAKSRQANSKQAGAIIKTLDRLLDKQSADLFGNSPLPTARVQIAQLRRRLHAFAETQANRAKDGWKIKYTEVDAVVEEVTLEVDGQPMRLVGRIDRIDEHADGRLAILDYKTSEAGKSPDDTHRKKQEWVDLQLPIYRQLARGLGLGTQFDLGFVVISADVDKVEFKMASWNAAELAAADRTLEEVIRRIRRQEFWPPATIPSGYFDDFAAICMIGVQEREPM